MHSFLFGMPYGYFRCASVAAEEEQDDDDDDGGHVSHRYLISANVVFYPS